MTLGTYEKIVAADLQPNGRNEALALNEIIGHQHYASGTGYFSGGLQTTGNQTGELLCD